MSQPNSHPSNHRLMLEFDDGLYVVKLIHPPGGCVGADQCGHCAADLTDPDSSRCYDCKGEGPHECWIQGWFDNATAEELIHGRLEVEIDCRWEFDHMEAHVVGVTLPTGSERDGSDAIVTPETPDA